MRKYWASLTPEQRRKRNAKWQKAGVEAIKSSEVREKQGGLAKKRWKNPEYREKQSKAIKKCWDESPLERKVRAVQNLTNKETIRKRGESLKRSWANRSEEFKEEIAEKTRQTWQNKSDEERAKHGQISSKNSKKYWASLTPVERQERNKENIKAMHAATGTDKPTSIEIAIHQVLDKLEIKYEVHKVIDNLTVDIYIPELNLVVECDGNYWHNLPEQKHADIRRDYWLRSQGFKVIRIWEKDINADAMSTIKNVLGLSEGEDKLPQSLQLMLWDE